MEQIINNYIISIEGSDSLIELKPPTHSTKTTNVIL